MSIAAAFIKELDMETPATRKCLERIPESKWSFKPHPRSMVMSDLVQLVAEIPQWITHIAQDSEIDLATYPHPKFTTTKEVVKHLDESLANAKKALSKLSDKDFNKQFQLKANDKVLSTEVAFDTITNTINHWVHHRGQLTVYMRLNDIAVPSIYGPSADENPFK